MITITLAISAEGMASLQPYLIGNITIVNNLFPDFRIVVGLGNYSIVVIIFLLAGHQQNGTGHAHANESSKPHAP